MMLNTFVRTGNRIFIYLLIFALLGLQCSIASGSVFVNHTIQLSSPRTSFGSIQVNNKIYFAGGFGYHDYVASNIVDVLDLTNNTITQLTLGSARGMITPVAIEPRIYFIGGYEYLNPPWRLESDFSFTTSFASGPTVRSPTKLALYGSTLTVIGPYSVDFFNTQTGSWTTNPKLTAKMMTLYGTTTFAHQNCVFVFGGYDMKTNVWSNSVWMIDAPLSDPIEYTNQAPEKAILSSTLDANNRAVVFQYSDMVVVYHIPTKQWFNRDASGFVSSVSYFDSTIVFLPDGYWTLDWTTMSNNWTPVTELTLAFAIADQFLYSTRDQNSGSWTIVINSNVTPSVEVQTLLGGLQAETILRSVELSATVVAFVTPRGSVFKYDASNRQFAQFSVSSTQPRYLFAINNHTVCLISGASPYYMDLMDSETYVVDSHSPSFLPMALVNGQLIDIFSRNKIDVSSFAETTMPISLLPPTSLWVQEGTNFFTMLTFSPGIVPPTLNYSVYMDVYNYVEETWETSIKIGGTPTAKGYHQAVAFNDSLVIFSPTQAVIHKGDQAGWVTIKDTAFSYLIQDNPTFAPIPMINDKAYCVYPGPGMNVVSWPLSVTKPLFDDTTISDSSTAITRFIVPYQSKMLFLATRAKVGIYEQIIFYTIEDDHFESASFPVAQSALSLVMYDDFLLAFGNGTSEINYFYPSNLGWGTEPFDNSFLPAVLQTLPADKNSSTVLMIAGGVHRERYYYSDAVQFLVLNLTIPVAPPVAPPSTPLTVQQPSVDSVADNSSTIIIAVVVPVGAVVIAGVLLAVLLIRRNKKKKRQTTTSELESRYGQWFTPFSDIQFGRQLGQGANGQVFEGTWKNTKVALKVSSTQANSSVISELEVMINMRPHPNVIQLFGFSIHPETNSVILIIEYCNGGSLDAALYDSQKPLTTQQKWSWIAGIAQGLNHLHSNNIVHRDVAARNVLLHQNEPKLTDFGMSRFVEEDQKGTTRSELGPIRWMSPESLKYKQYSNKSGVSGSAQNMTAWALIILNRRVVIWYSYVRDYGTGRAAQFRRSHRRCTTDQRSRSRSKDPSLVSSKNSLYDARLLAN